MKTCDKNLKPDDSFATNKKMSLCGRKIFLRKEAFNFYFLAR